MNCWRKSTTFLPGWAGFRTPGRPPPGRRCPSWQLSDDITCMNWREASKSSTGYILIRKNFIPIIKLMMLWTTYGLCSLCRNSLSSAINFFFTAGNLRREHKSFICQITDYNGDLQHLGVTGMGVLRIRVQWLPLCKGSTLGILVGSNLLLSSLIL